MYKEKLNSLIKKYLAAEKNLKEFELLTGVELTTLRKEAIAAYTSANEKLKAMYPTEYLEHKAKLEAFAAEHADYFKSLSNKN